MSLTCFQTKIRNTSGRSMVVNFLQRGKRLEDQEEITVDGDPRISMKNKRSRDSFNTLLENQDLTILSTPSQVYYDPTKAMPKVLEVDNVTVSVDNPCVGAYSSSMT